MSLTIGNHAPTFVTEHQSKDLTYDTLYTPTVYDPAGRFFSTP